MRALHLVPDLPSTNSSIKPLHQTRKKQDGIQELIRLDSVLFMPKQGANANTNQSFDTNLECQRIKVTEDHRKEYMVLKGATAQEFMPQGTLVTTLYEHKSPVNTIAVTQDHRNPLFLTGSREDRTINVWSVADIEKDVTSHSVHSFSSPNLINQITMIQGSNSVAVAGTGGIDILDLERTTTSTSEMTMGASEGQIFVG